MLQRPAMLVSLFVALSLGACQRGASGEEGTPSAETESAPSEASAPAAAVDSSSACGEVEGEWRVDTSVETIDGARVLVATVCAGVGFHANTEYPRWGVQVAEDAPVAAGATVAKDEATEFAEHHVTFHVPAEGEGEGEVAGRVRFSVCNDEACLNPSADVTWTVASAE